MAVTDPPVPARVPDPTPARRGPRLGPAPTLVRVGVVLGAVLVVVAAGRVEPFPVAALTIGAMLALARPSTVGAWVALPAAAWTFGSGAGTDHGTGAVLLAAAGVYLLHTATAAAAVVPWGARVAPEVAGRWLLRCLPAVVVTAVLAVLDAAVGPTPRSTLFAAVAVAVVLAAAATLTRLLAGFGDGPR